MLVGISIGKGFARSYETTQFFRSNELLMGFLFHTDLMDQLVNSQDPGRVFKGKKMAGHMGAKKVTKQNLKIINVDKDNKLISIMGSVPGKKNTVVFVKDAIKKS